MDGHGWDDWDDDPPGHGDPYGDDPFGHLPGEDPLHAHLTGDGHSPLDDPAGDDDPAGHGHHPGEPLDDTHDLHDPGDPFGDPGDDTPGPGDHLDAPTPGAEPDGAGHDGRFDPDTVVGGDPDTIPYADDATWYHTGFPPPLTLDDPPDPVDGYPWADAGHLGEPAGLDDPDSHTRWLLPSPDDLAAHDATTTATWASLLASPDPATSSLARWWAPGH